MKKKAGKKMEVYTHGIERVTDITLSNSATKNGWEASRGAVRWGKDDYVLWANGEFVAAQVLSSIACTGCTEAEARAFVATGKMPKGARCQQLKLKNTTEGTTPWIP